MKTGMTTKNLKLVSLGMIAAFYVGCAPQMKSTSSYEGSSTPSQNIVGGENADLAFEKANGIVGLYIVAKPLDLSTCKFSIDPKTQKKTVDPKSCQPQIDPSNGKPVVKMSVCTGTLIEKRIVLTAAHCVASPFITRVIVIFNTSFEQVFNQISPQGALPASAREAAHVVPHADYLKDVTSANDSTTKTHNDVALIGLYQDAPADFKFAHLDTREAKALENSSVILSGFGVTNAIVSKPILDAKGQPILDENGNPMTQEVPSQGTGILRKVDSILVTAVTADQKEITLDQKNSRGACHGDSGGPAFSKLADGSLVQVGVTSRGTEKLGNCNSESIYSSVSGFAPWIKDQSKILRETLAFL